MYAITMKPCMPRLITMLKGASGFTKARKDKDAVGLIMLIKGI